MGAGAVGVPAGAGFLNPPLGQAIAIIEGCGMAAVLIAALFGSVVVSERAFRLLRWLADRPEPPAPITHPPHPANPTTRP